MYIIFQVQTKVPDNENDLQGKKTRWADGKRERERGE